MKHSRLVDALFSESPLRSKGYSKGVVESSKGNGTAEKTTATPISVAPVRAKPVFSLLLSDPEPESDDEV